MEVPALGTSEAGPAARVICMETWNMWKCRTDFQFLRDIFSQNTEFDFNGQIQTRILGSLKVVSSETTDTSWLRTNIRIIIDHAVGAKLRTRQGS